MTSRNDELFTAAQRVIPGGVNSPVRAFGSVGGQPFFTASASGATLVDTDGKRYVDWVQSWGALILGHAHPKIVEAIQRQAALGTHFAQPTRDLDAVGENLVLSLIHI